MKHLYSFIAAMLLSYSSFAQGPIMGTFAICAGAPTTLTNTVSGGVWSSSMSSVATIGSASGVVIGAISGTSTISYTIASTTVTQVITINPVPTASPTSPTVCIGGNDTVTGSPAMGTWSSSNTAVAPIYAAGILQGFSAGTSNITYTLPTGCYTNFVVTVNATLAPITGTAAVCPGYTTSLSDVTTGAMWSSASTAVATIGSTGIVTGISPGTVNISYTFITTGCTATRVVTVNLLTTPITGLSSVCLGGADTLADATSGGTWSATPPSVITMYSSGIALGFSVGTATITYTAPTGCSATHVVTVSATVPAIAGSLTICDGGATTLSDVAAGGTWTSASVGIISLDEFTGVATALSVGVADVTYSLPTGCLAATSVTVNASPSVTFSAIPGDTVCAGAAVQQIALTSGFSTMSYTWYVNATVAGSTDTVSYHPAAGDSVSCKITGIRTCSGGLPDTITSNALTIVVNDLPTINATSATNCGGSFSLTGSGAGAGGVYVWSPSAGLSCTTCAAPVASISTGTTYSVTGTNTAGCAGTSTITLDANRISGYISLTAAPTYTLKVWLIQFNPSDSSLTGEDSTLTCMDSGTPYYEFDGVAAGSYMVKAKLQSSVPGTSGYVPTYGLSSAVWDSAMTITHAAATDTQHINMIYGTVPTGPGFIGGLISSGAGKGTSGGVPVAGMLVYLKDNATNTILTYTYTDATGAYSFSGIGNGSYIVYPVDYHYHTVPWTNVTLTTSNETMNAASFYEHTTSRTITPFGLVCRDLGTASAYLTTYPNPAGNEVTIAWGSQITGNGALVITDITGKELYNAPINLSAASGSTNINTTGLDNGIYFISIRSAGINYSNKLLIAR